MHYSWQVSAIAYLSSGTNFFIFDRHFPSLQSNLFSLSSEFRQHKGTIKIQWVAACLPYHHKDPYYTSRKKGSKDHGNQLLHLSSGTNFFYCSSGTNFFIFYRHFPSLQSNLFSLSLYILIFLFSSEFRQHKGTIKIHWDSFSWM